MAPEILKGKYYTTKADVWSLGIILYEMFYGFCPFEANSIPKLVKIINSRSVKFPSLVNKIS